MKRAALLAIVFASSTAAAESIDRYYDGSDYETEGREVLGAPDGYVSSGALRGKDKHDLLGFFLDGGFRIGHTPVFVRGMGVAGTTSLRRGRGTYQELRAGAEARTCSRTGRVCGSAGLDIGVHRASFDPYVEVEANPGFKTGSSMPITDPNRFDSMITVPRFTLDAGGRIRFRGVVELPRHMTDTEQPKTGFSVSLGLGVGF